MQTDPLEIDDNAYHYCYNDPVNYVDPWGLFGVAAVPYIPPDITGIGIGIEVQWDQNDVTGLDRHLPRPDDNAVPDRHGKEFAPGSQEAPGLSEGVYDKSENEGDKEGEKEEERQEEGPRTPPKTPEDVQAAEEGIEKKYSESPVKFGLGKKKTELKKIFNGYKGKVR